MACELELQKALVAKLKADAGVSALVSGRVYDQPPQKATRPYIRIGYIKPRPMRTDCAYAETVTFGLEAHSRPETSGRVEATRCAMAVQSAIDKSDLPMTGFDTVQVNWTTQEVTQDSDGKSYTAVVVFQATVNGPE